MISSTKLIRFLKHKIVLLDTNIFRDILSKPTILSEFLEKLKSSGITLGTIDAVKYELLKGSSDENKYKERAKFIDKTIDITINLPPSSFELVYDLQGTKFQKEVRNLIAAIPFGKKKTYKEIAENLSKLGYFSFLAS